MHEKTLMTVKKLSVNERTVLVWQMLFKQKDEVVMEMAIF